jgi:hypothetical protein
MTMVEFWMTAAMIAAAVGVLAALVYLGLKL